MYESGVPPPIVHGNSGASGIVRMSYFGSPASPSPSSPSLGDVGSSVVLVESPPPVSSALSEAEALSLAVPSGGRSVPQPAEIKAITPTQSHCRSITNPRPRAYMNVRLVRNPSVGALDFLRLGTPQETLPSDEGRQPSSPAPRPGDAIGRYRLGKRLGRGGMGEVYAAFDPELERSVALKLVLASRSGRDDPEALLHEARAAAALTHPNVVTIHDIGSDGGRVYIAMELIDGMTLRQWVKRTTPPPAAIVDAFVGAARGLAAAHAAGVVHRDFKPDNVMVSSEGRIIVLDFGLAGFAEPTEPGKQRGTDHKPTAGTPAYMAPEQHLRLPATPASDQFAFCVALHEMLTGRFPFTGKGALQIATAIAEDNRHHESLAALPRRVRPVVERGIEAQPGDRWPSMTDVADALARHRSRAPLWIGALLVVTAGAAWFLSSGPDAGCEDGQHQIDDDWSTEHQALLRESFGAVEIKYASEAHVHVEAGLDEYAAAWQAAYRNACAVEPEDLDQSMTCLRESRRDFAALVDVLAEIEPDALSAAVRSVAALEPPRACLDVSDQVAVPAELAARVEDLRSDLAHARALRLAGKYERSLARLRMLGGTAREIGFLPAQLQVEAEWGHAAEAAGDWDEARTVLEGAFETAQAAGLDYLARKAAVRLVAVVGYRLGRRDAGREWARHAEALLRRTAAAGTKAEGSLRTNQGLIAEKAGDFELATRRAEEALAIAEQLEDRRGQAKALNNLGNALRGRSEFDAALAAHRRALQLRKELWGASHPDVASSLVNIANVHVQRAQLDEADRLYGEAQELMQRALGRSHPNVVILLENRATVAARAGRVEEALSLVERALAARRNRLGADHPETLGLEYKRGEILDRAKRYDEALRVSEGLLPRFEAALGAGDWRTGLVWIQVASARKGLGRTAESVAAFEQVLTFGDGLSDATRLAVELELFELRDAPKLERAEIMKRLDAFEARARELDSSLAVVERLRKTL